MTFVILSIWFELIMYSPMIHILNNSKSRILPATIHKKKNAKEIKNEDIERKVNIANQTNSDQLFL